MSTGVCAGAATDQFERRWIDVQPCRPTLHRGRGKSRKPSTSSAERVLAEHRAATRPSGWICRSHLFVMTYSLGKNDSHSSQHLGVCSNRACRTLHFRTRHSRKL